MAKPSARNDASKGARDLLEQVNRARQALEYFDATALNERGELRDGVTVRSRLNAAKAHVIRAIEMSQTL